MATSHTFLRGLVDGMLKPYLERNANAARALESIRDIDGATVHWDHFAFRTFDSDGCGIEAMARVFTDLGYERRDELRFEKKNLQAYWYAPPEPPKGEDPYPRVFISQLLVDKLSPEAQSIIRRYTSAGSRIVQGHAPLASITGIIPWPLPTLEDYHTLAQESEYAAWTLINSYRLNHTTVAVHRLGVERISCLEDMNEFLVAQGLALNAEGGGVLKVSPDGGLRQSSTVADTYLHTFAGGETAEVPASYIEFAERLPLPEFFDVPTDQLTESQRREGFEVGNADGIFESTSNASTGLKAA